MILYGGWLGYRPLVPGEKKVSLLFPYLARPWPDGTQGAERPIKESLMANMWA